MKRINLEVFRNVCESCGLEFESLGQSDDYGPIIYSNGLGSMRFLDPLADPTWPEVSAIVDTLTASSSTRVTDAQKASLFHSALARTVDPPEVGAFVSAWEYPPCARCGSKRRSFFGPFEPLRFRDVELEEVSHDRWNRLSLKQRIEEAAKAIADRNNDVG